MIEKVTTPKKLKVPEKLKKLVIDCVRRHAWNIGVSHYVGDILWMEEDKKSDDRGDSSIHGEMTTDRRYLKGTIKIYPAAIKAWEMDGNPTIEELISHEVAHLATQHLYDIATARYCDDGEMKDAWETLTTIVGRLSLKLDRELKKKP